MKGYLSIGKVSKLKNVSIKSLRYYDRIGVLPPAYINEKTNYRYYTEDQLYLLDAISLCIELGIPLSRFESYLDPDGKLNIQRLLFDGKDLAEKKIRQMRACIDQLQQTLQRLEEAPAEKAAAKETEKPESKKTGKADSAQKPADAASEEVFPSVKLDQRYVIVAEFDEVTTATRYNHMLLSLFVNAEKKGMNAGYPTGLLYERNGERCKKYVFATLSDVDPKNLPSDAEGSGFRLLPAGEYFRSRSTEHRIEQASDLFAPVLSGHDRYMLVETDVMEEGQKGVKELQLLLL